MTPADYIVFASVLTLSTLFYLLCLKTQQRNTLMKSKLVETNRSLILAALRRGTRILAFEYHGVTRNALVGAKWMESPVRWGVKLNRALIQHKGRLYLHAQVHNESGSPKVAKVFALDEIQNLRGA